MDGAAPICCAGVDAQERRKGAQSHGVMEICGIASKFSSKGEEDGVSWMDHYGDKCAERKPRFIDGKLVRNKEGVQSFREKPDSQHSLCELSTPRGCVHLLGCR